MKQAKNTEKTNTKTSKNSIPAHERAVNAGAFEDSWEGRNWSKPKLEEARLGIPMSMELLNSPDDEFPIMADSAEYGRRFRVDDGKVYTVRLGIRSDAEGIGAIPGNSAATIFIPTVPARDIQITATFAFPEMFPVIFADAVCLYSGTEFSLEYVYGSAQLECNNIINTKALPPQITIAVLSLSLSPKPSNPTTHQSFVTPTISLLPILELSCPQSALSG